MYFRGKRKSAQDVFISDPIDTDRDGNALTLQDVMADDRDVVETIEEQLRAEELYQKIRSQLQPREQEILGLRYGLWGGIPLTQREVAARCEISRSYVSRIEKRALEKLKDGFEKGNK